MQKVPKKLKNSLHLSKAVKMICLRILLPAAAALLLEILLFNYRSFVVFFQCRQPESLSLDSGVSLSNAVYQDGEIVLEGKGASVTFNNVNTDIVSVTLDACGSDKIGTVNVSLTDASHSYIAYSPGSYSFHPGALESLNFSVYSQGTAHALTLTFNSASIGLHIRGITLNEPGFHFSKVRFCFIFFCFLLLAVVLDEKVRKLVYDPESLGQNTVYVCVLAALCVFSVILAIPFTKADDFNLKNISYPLENDVSQYGIYIQQFDAFQKGQLNLDIPVSSELLQLKNPYDRTARDKYQVSFAFDRAYYKGKYYSYYGITPLLIIYYPYYFLTGALPSDLCASMLIVPFAVTVLGLLLREILLRFVKRINFLLLLFGTAGEAAVSLLYVLEVSTSFYCMPYFTAILFSALFLLLFLRGTGDKCRHPAGCFVFSGISYVLAAGSRPLCVLFLIAALPAAVHFLKTAALKRADKIKCIAAFALPTAAGAVCLMMYNLLRFGSPFEFGLNYQLTVTNPRNMNFRIWDLVPAVYHYFLQFPSIDPNFPFFHVSEKLFQHYGGYEYESPMAGALTFPVMWWLFAAFSRKTHKTREEQLFKISVFVISLIMAVSAFSMSGMVLRYVTDYQWLLCMLAICLMMEYCGSLDVAICSILLSMLISAAMLFSNENNMIQRELPNVYAAIQELCEWW